MDRTLQKQIAQMYPKKNFKAQRTPLQQALNQPIQQYPLQSSTEYYSSSNNTNKVSPRARKILIVIICSILAGLLFSSFAYTMSDNLANKMHLELFDENGNPGMTIMVFHLLLFALLMYLILTGSGY